MSETTPERTQLLQRAAWTRSIEPIFLVGCGRSGTTWLQAMLATHPQIITGPELRLFSTLALSERFFLMADPSRGAGLAYYYTPETYYDLVANLFWSLISTLPPPSAEPRYFLEKTPEHTLNGQFILRTLPNARFIHLIRDARAVAASYLRAAKGWGKEWAPKTALASVRIWQEYVTAGRRISQYVPTRDQYIEIKYEELRQDPHGSLQKLFSWLALPQDQQLLESAVQLNSLDNSRKSPTPFPSIPASSLHAEGRARQTYPEGFVGTSAYKPEDVQLTWLQRLRVEHDAGELLRDLGYTDSKKRLTLWERVLISVRLRKKLGLPQV